MHSPRGLVIYCDAKHEGLWFRDLSPLLDEATFATIGRRGTKALRCADDSPSTDIVHAIEAFLEATS